MLTIHTRSSTVELPPDVATLAGFRVWAGSVPEHAAVWFVNGDVWFDSRPQQLFAEAAVRVAIVSELATLAKGREGHVFSRGAFWVARGVEVAGNPDGMYIADESIESGRVRFLPDPPYDCTEVEGTPDMVLDIVKTAGGSPPLREAYYDAGIPEYWLVDARGDAIEFHIYKRGAKRYSVTKTQPGGWAKSAAFGKSFRLVRGTDATGNPEFTLEVK
jgi:Uma2 family endonuclease